MRPNIVSEVISDLCTLFGCWEMMGKAKKIKWKPSTFRISHDWLNWKFQVVLVFFLSFFFFGFRWQFLGRQKKLTISRQTNGEIRFWGFVVLPESPKFLSVVRNGIEMRVRDLNRWLEDSCFVLVKRCYLWIKSIVMFFYTWLWSFFCYLVQLSSVWLLRKCW